MLNMPSLKDAAFPDDFSISPVILQMYHHFTPDYGILQVHLLTSYNHHAQYIW